MTRLRLAMLAISSAALWFTARPIAARDPSPATHPAGWFAGAAAPATQDADSDAAILARLFPELAKMDATVRASTPRIVFDALGARGKPNLKLPQMYVPGGFFTEASMRDVRNSPTKDPFLQVPDERRSRIAAVEARAREASLCLDIESLPLGGHSAKEAANSDRSVRMIAQIVGWVRAQDPNLRLFIYGCFPAGENYIGISRWKSATTQPSGSMYGWWKASWPNFEKQRDEWRSSNDLLTRRDEAAPNKTVLSDLFDGTCPTLYLYPNQGMTDPVTEIPGVVREQINEARRYGKPVYPFVWYLLCDTTIPVPLPQWTAELREVLKWADGVVLWDGPTVWNNRLALRVKIALLIADKKGEMSDTEVYDAVRTIYPNDAEIEILKGAPSTQPEQK